MEYKYVTIFINNIQSKLDEMSKQDYRLHSVHFYGDYVRMIWYKIITD